MLAVAFVLTSLNAVKPLHIDDTAYCSYAHQIAQNPLDPYGFQLFWYQHPQHANTILAPPLLPYWLALSIRLFGERPVLWKVSLFPFALLFVGSLHLLLTRFARGLRIPLLWLTVLSPAFLPSFNLMLDIPALALGLAAVVLFMLACDTDSLVRAALAGLLAGLAMQTKYTGFVAPVTMFLYAGTAGWFGAGRTLRAMARTFVLWLVAAVLAAGVFGGWEAWMAASYQAHGGSHFLYHYHQSQQEYEGQFPLEILVAKFETGCMPLLPLTGGIAAAQILVGLAALSRRWQAVSWAGFMLFLGYALVASVEGVVWLRITPAADLFGPRQPLNVSWWLEQLIFTLYGGFLVSVVLIICWRLVRAGRGGLWRPALWRRRRLDWFLLLWLALEVAGYFLLTPFLAVRRVLGVVVVGTLIAGRLASFTCRSERLVLLVRAIAVTGVILGLGFYAVDLREAWARKQAAEDVAARIRQKDPQAIIWYTGHWEFQYYAEGLGMKAVVPDRSMLRTGDWLVVPDGSIHSQGIRIDPEKTQRQEPVIEIDRLPVATVWAFYGTATGAPLEHHEGPRVRIDIYRVTGDFLP